jgi:hypothetical protein
MGGPSLTGAARSLLSLRTDSANRGFCIFRFTLEMILLAISIRFFFFIIMRVKFVHTICTQGHNALTEELPWGARTYFFHGLTALIFPERPAVPLPGSRVFGILSIRQGPPTYEFRRIKHDR